MSNRLLILVLITQSCGQMEHQDFTHIFVKNELPDHFVEPEFIPVILEYAEMLKENDISTDLFKKLQRIEYKPIGETTINSSGDEVNIIGRCIVFINEDIFGKRKEYRLVEIDPSIEDKYLKETIFHELGHCINNLDHSRNKDSIMYESSTESEIDWSDKKSDLVSYIKDGES